MPVVGPTVTARGCLRALAIAVAGTTTLVVGGGVFLSWLFAPCNYRMHMPFVPDTTFAMGCDPQRDPSCGPDERPQHLVDVKAFRIERFEVSRSDYAYCVTRGACTPAPGAGDLAVHPEQPMSHVTWHQARAFCRARNMRLPTEAEWELAARGTDGRIYPWGDTKPTCASAHTHDCGNGLGEIGDRHAGGSPYEVLDMAGNVDEWVEDAYARYGSHAAPSGSQRVARGGAWDAWHIRSTARSALAPDYRDATLGFRCAAGPFP